MTPSKTTFLFAVLLLVLSLPGCLAEQEPERPNILFIFSDDQRADALGAYGNEFISTPSLDKLSEVGFNFRNAHIMGSVHGAVCQPSRAMLMSGRSLYHVGTTLDTVATFPEQLQKHGYITFGTGKWHQSQESFARSFSSGQDVFFGGMSDHDATPVRDLLADGSFTEVERKSFSTDLFADATIQFIDDYALSDTSAPFLTYVAFTVPHDPRTPKPDYVDQYGSSDIPLPPNFLPVHPFHNGWMTGRDETLAAWPRPEADVRAQIAEYYGLISHMDARIGDILEALDRNGLRENTIVIFSSDNGLALGSHGLMGKQSLYEHSNRVPLIVSGPGIPGGRSDDLVVLYDLFPTIADLTGMELPPSIDGRTLKGVWENGLDGPRDVLYTVYEDLHRGVTEKEWKLIRYPKLDRNQLFNLASDPFEMNDLSGELRYAGQVERLLAVMEAEHDLADDPHPLYVDSLHSDVFDYSKIERKPDRHQPQWVIDKYFGK
jgi:arylsulfatase A-like enzyme